MVSSHANPFHWHPHFPSPTRVQGVFRRLQHPSKSCLWGTPLYMGKVAEPQRRGSQLAWVFSLFLLPC